MALSEGQRGRGRKPGAATRARALAWMPGVMETGA